MLHRTLQLYQPFPGLSYPPPSPPYLKRKNITFNKKDTLGTLINIFQRRFKDKTHKRILGKIMEVHNFDRIVAAHDIKQDRHIITKDEADHAWTAVQVILNQLLKMEYEPYLE